MKPFLWKKTRRLANAGPAREKGNLPFWWPRWMKALWGFWAIVSHEPSFVRISATSCPVEVSWYLRYPALPCTRKLVSSLAPTPRRRKANSRSSPRGSGTAGIPSG